jgi:ribonuclease HII
VELAEGLLRGSESFAPLLATHGLELSELLAQVAGIDEVGRGPLAGPVVAAAVILDPAHPIAGLTDSKQLSAAKRVQLARQIRRHAACYAIASASVAEIETLNILGATMLAMSRACAQLSLTPSCALVDGNRLPKLLVPALSLVKGDARVAAISAASIIAKVSRDRLMSILACRYPGYGFERHSGYGTKVHLQALAELGPCPVHRPSFAPVRRALAAMSA